MSLEIRPNIWYQPFSPSEGFLPHDLDELHRIGSRDTVLDTPFNFQGVDGNMLAVAEPWLLLHPQISYEAPLGVDYKLESTKGRARMTAAPIWLAEIFKITDRNQLDLLNRYITEFKLGDETFFLRCGEGIHAGQALDLGSGRTPKVFNDEMMNSEGFYKRLVLPYSPDRIAQVSMRIKEGGMYSKNLPVTGDGLSSPVRHYLNPR